MVSSVWGTPQITGQARIPASSELFPEAYAGMMENGDIGGGKQALRNRIKEEILKESGLPAEVIDQTEEIVSIRGLFPSVHSPEEIGLFIDAGKALKKEQRSEAEKHTHGEIDEHEATKNRFLQSPEELMAISPDLKTYLLSLLSKALLNKH